MNDGDIADGLEVAISAIKTLTAELHQLREQRERYVRTFGWKKARETFAELDSALRALRKAAKT